MPEVGTRADGGPATAGRPSARSEAFRGHPFDVLACVAVVALLSLVARPGSPVTAAVPAGLFALTAVLARAAGPPTWRAWRRATRRALLPLTLAVLALNGLFYPAGVEVLARLGPATVTREGLAFALVVAARLAAILGAVALAARSMRLEDAATALASAGAPHPWPALVPIAGGALPGLVARAHAIHDAQRARGLRLRGPLGPRPTALAALAGPLVAATLDETTTRAATLEARGLGLPGPRTHRAPLVDSPRARWRRRLAVAAALAALVAARWPR